MSERITPFLWFDTQAEQAAAYYCSIFKNSRIISVSHYPEAGPGETGAVMTVEWELDGQRFIGLNGGPEFTFTEAVSFQVDCEDQAEVDYYWDALTADGGEESQCGWCKDRYGLSWQIVPKGFFELVSHPDKERANRAMKAMFGMKKLDLAALEAAAGATG